MLVAAATLAVSVVACGPGKPVVLYVPPSITVSERPAGRPVAVASSSKTFWEAMSSLDTAFTATNPVTDSQQAFARALGLVMSGHTREAALALDSIRLAPGDTLVRAAGRHLLTAMLQYQAKWKLLAELKPAGSADTTNTNKAGVESWASAFRGVAPRRMTFPVSPVILPLTLSLSGSPVIPVTINGKVRMLWLDTGSSMSILASDIAADVGVVPLVSDTLEVATTTGRVQAMPASIARVQLGGIDIANVTAMIVDAERMELRLDDGTNPNMAVRIDGVIGFDIISRLDIRIDYSNRTVTLAKPEVSVPLSHTGRNLFWVGTPVVRLVTPKGVPLHFSLDTGGQETYATDGLIAKTKMRTFAGERRLIGGFSGLTIVRGRFIGELRVTMAGQPLIFRKLLVFAPAYSTFVTLDGVLGNDVGKGGALRIDATNGLFILELPKPPAGLRISG